MKNRDGKTPQDSGGSSPLCQTSPETQARVLEWARDFLPGFKQERLVGSRAGDHPCKT